MIEELLTPEELAGILRIKRQTLYTWIHRGSDIPFFKERGTIRFRKEAILNWISEKEKERKKRNFEL